MKPQLSTREELGGALANFTWRRLFIRLVAIATCLVALSGIGASIYGYRQVDRAEAEARQQLQQISDTFAQVAASLRTVGDSATNAAGSASEAKTSLASASSATRGTADTLDQTANVINFTIPFSNVRPLAGVDINFRDQARQLRILADQIDQTGVALGQNDTDLKAIAADVAAMSRQMSTISTQLRQFAGDGSGPGAMTQITTGTRLIIAWSVVIHLLLFGMGISLYLLTGDPPRRADPPLDWRG